MNQVVRRIRRDESTPFESRPQFAKVSKFAADPITDNDDVLALEKCFRGMAT